MYACIKCHTYPHTGLRFDPRTHTHTHNPDSFCMFIFYSFFLQKLETRSEQEIQLVGVLRWVMEDGAGIKVKGHLKQVLDYTYCTNTARYWVMEVTSSRYKPLYYTRLKVNLLH